MRFLIRVLIAMTAVVSVASAQTYPSKPIRLVVPYAPGGATDNVGRVLGQSFAKTLGQSVFIDNKPGASGVVGSEIVAKSPADGYTLLLGTVGSMTINIHFLQKKPYGPFKDFAPISLIALNDGVLIVNPSFPAKSFAEFVDVVRRSPGKYSFASSGAGGPTHLGGELIKSRAGLDLVHIPYKGDGPAVLDVVAGNCPIMVSVLASVNAHVRSGQVRAVAALGANRFQQLPGLPTVAESGYPGFSAGAWLALFAPAGTPADIVRALNDATRRAIADPEIRGRLIDLGSAPVANSPEEMAAVVREDFDKWGDADPHGQAQGRLAVPASPYAVTNRAEPAYVEDADARDAQIPALWRQPACIAAAIVPFLEA